MESIILGWNNSKNTPKSVSFGWFFAISRTVLSQNDTCKIVRRLKILGKLNKYIKKISTNFQPFIGSGRHFFLRKTGILAIFLGIFFISGPKKHISRKVTKLKISGNVIHILRKLSWKFQLPSSSGSTISRPLQI